MRYVLISTDVTDLTIYAGPLLWDGVVTLPAPSGRVYRLEADALAAGYTYPGPPVAVVNEQTLLVKAAAALANNITYLGLTSPTNAQVVAQVAALTRQVNALIRLALGALDSTTGS